MASYKLLALDMDGTLLDSRKRVLPKTRQALQGLADKGIPISYSTGRGPAELHDYEDELSMIRYGVCISGGLVYDFSQHKPVATRTFDPKLALRLISVAREEDVIVHFLTADKSIVSKRDLPLLPEFGMAIYQDAFERNTTRVDDAAHYLEQHPDEVCKINFYHRTPASRERAYQRVKDLPLQLVFAEETSLECTPEDVTKGAGLAALCDYLGISAQDAVAVGDAPNDESALRTAGLAVAMGNATDDIRQLADVVVADNDHDGIAEVVECFF